MDMNYIIKFDIPDTSYEFNEYVLEQFREGKLMLDIHRDIASNLHDIELGISDADPRIKDELKSFSEKGYGSVEFTFIALKACYEMGAVYHGF